MNKVPGMFDTPAILNLHLRLWDSYIADWKSSRHYAAEGRRCVAVTHLALLGVKVQEPAFWVFKMGSNVLLPIFSFSRKVLHTFLESEKPFRQDANELK